MSTAPRPGTSTSDLEDADRVDPRTRLRQVLVLALAAVLAAVMLVLGIWQMSVYRTQGTRVLQERADRPPVSMDAQLDSQHVPVGDLYGLQVTLHGRYLATKPILVGTSAPYRVLMPFRDGQRIIGVVRGTVPSRTASVPPAPTGIVDQSGIMLPSENKATSAPSSPSGMPEVNLERLAQTWPSPVLSGFVTLSASASSAQHLGPQAVQMPDNANGRAQNLGYAMQWWVFAIFSVVAGIVFARTMGRRSRSRDVEPDPTPHRPGPRG